MSNLQQYVAAIGAFQGLLMLVLLTTDRRVSQASRLLGVICLILSLMFGLSFLLTARNEALFLHVAGWLFYLPASLGGLIFSLSHTLRALRRSTFPLSPRCCAGAANDRYPPVGYELLYVYIFLEYYHLKTIF